MTYIPASIMIRAILACGYTQEWLALVTGISRANLIRLMKSGTNDSGLAVGSYLAIRAVWEQVVKGRDEDNGD